MSNYGFTGRVVSGCITVCKDVKQVDFGRCDDTSAPVGTRGERRAAGGKQQKELEFPVSSEISFS